MKVYDRPYNIFSTGSYVVIRDDQVEIVDNRYSTDVLAEFYFHEIVINKLEMNVTMIAITGEVLSVIHHAKRIVDMRSSPEEDPSMRTDEHE